MGNLAALKQFDLVLNETGPTQFSGPERVLNLMGPQTYFWGHPLRNNVRRRSIQSGTKIQDRIQLVFTQTAKMIGFDDDVTRSRRGKVTNWSIGWRLMHNALTWNHKVFSFNPAEMTAEALGQKYSDAFRNIMADYWVSTNVFLEDLCWTVPDPTRMEGEEEGDLPNSYYCVMNESPNGLFGQGAPGIPVNQQYTEFMRVNPNTPDSTGKWERRLRNYGSAQDPVDYTSGIKEQTYPLMTAFDNMMLDLRWDRAPMHGEYDEPTIGEGNHPTMIVTQREGILNLKQAQRILDDNWSHHDSDFSGPEPIWGGIPIVWSESMDTDEVFPTGPGGAMSTWDDTSNNNAGPRYHLYNWNYWNFVLHQDDALVWHQGMPREPENRPLERYIDAFMTFNRLCNSPRHQGVIAPGINVVSVRS